MRCDALCTALHVRMRPLFDERSKTPFPKLNQCSQLILYCASITHTLSHRLVLRITSGRRAVMIPISSDVFLMSNEVAYSSLFILHPYVQCILL